MAVFVYAASAASAFTASFAGAVETTPQVGVANRDLRLTFERKNGRIIIRTFKKALEDGTVLTAADMADPENGSKGKRFLLTERSVDESVFRAEFRARLEKLSPAKLSQEQKLQLERIKNIAALKADITEKKSRKEELQGQITALELEKEAVTQSFKALKERRKSLAQAKRDFPKVDHSREQAALDAQEKALEERSRRREELVQSTENAIRDLDPCLSASELSLEHSEQTLSDLERVFERMELDHGGLLGMGSARLQQILTLEINGDSILFQLLNEMSQFEDPSRTHRRSSGRDTSLEIAAKWQGNLGQNLSFAQARKFCRDQGLRLPTTEDFTALLKSGRADEALAEPGEYWAASPLSSVTGYVVNSQTGVMTRVNEALNEALNAEPNEGEPRRLRVRCIVSSK